MSDRPEGTQLQANFRTPSGGLLNAYARDGAHLSQLLEELEGVASQVAALEGVFAALGNAAHISAPPSQQTGSEVPPRASESPPRAGSAAPSCVHGVRTYREGVSKAGKPYKAFFCPSSDRNAQCAPEWA